MAQDKEKITKLGLVAGAGELPLELVKSAQSQGVEVIVCACNKNTYKQLKNITETFYLSPLEVFSILDKGKAYGVKHVSFIGKFPKSDLFRNIFKLDTRIFSELKKLQNLNDDSIHLRVVKLLEEEHGMIVVDQTKYLKHFFPQEQIFSKRQASPTELEEIKYGLSMAKGIAALDIGQTVVVKNKAVIAVEAIEGTNKCIKRARAMQPFWPRSKTLTICKVSKPNQDKRFDVPAVGLETIKTMPPNSILAFEAGETFFLNKQQAIELADSKNILVGSFKLD